MSTVEQSYTSPEQLKERRAMYGIPTNLERFQDLEKAIKKYQELYSMSFYNRELGRRLSNKSVALYEQMITEFEQTAKREAYNDVFEAAKVFIETCEPRDLISEQVGRGAD